MVVGCNLSHSTHDQTIHVTLPSDLLYHFSNQTTDNISSFFRQLSTHLKAFCSKLQVTRFYYSGGEHTI